MRTYKLKYKNDVLDNIVPGTTLLDVSKRVQKDYMYDIISAKLNNQLVDLSKLVLEDGDVEFYDRSSSVGNRVYSRSLEFLVTVAVKNLFGKKSDVLINYSLDNGVYCEVVNIKLDENKIEKIEKEMKRIVKLDEPFNKFIVSRLDAIKYFKAHGQMDKVNNLTYNASSTIELYRLEDYYDFFFGPLVQSTSVLELFNLKFLDQDSFIMSYPSVKEPGIVPKYKHHDLVFKKYKEYAEWTKLIGLNMVSDLNYVGTLGKCNEVVRLFETHYEDQLSLVANKIFKKRKEIKLVLISGPSSSGKTTTAKKLSLYLRAHGLRPHQISLDNYFVDLDKTPKDENGGYDFSSIKATNTEQFNDDLSRLLRGEEVPMPTYNFKTGKSEYLGNTLKLEENDILIVEGIHTLNDTLTKKVKRENKFKIFIYPMMPMKIDNHNRVRTNDVRKLRRIVRDNRYRNKSAETTLKLWPNVVKEAQDNIFPYEDDVDAVINTALNYEVSVLRIFAEPLLYGIDSSSEVYPEAIRLINVLRQFLPISSEGVPKDSMLREFIGEGVFEEDRG